MPARLIITPASNPPARGIFTRDLSLPRSNLFRIIQKVADRARVVLVQVLLPTGLRRRPPLDPASAGRRALFHVTDRST